MRASQWVLGLATASAMVAAIAVGCGGSTNGGNATDSGALDVTTDHAPEAAQEAAPEPTPEAGPDVCTSDAMISSINVDGSVPGSDASASACVACVESACPMLIAECNAICGCPDAFLAFEQCLGAGGSVITCGQTN